MTLITPLIFLLPLLLAAAAASTVTLPLTQTPTSQTNLHHLSTAALTRAHRGPSTATTPLSPHSYGGYSVTLKFGTPPQQLPFVMDTGSDFVWFPCTHNYICKTCPPPSPKSHLHSFIPKLSSTSSILGCLSPKCGWAHHNMDPKSRCPNCSSNCTRICPPYLIVYGSGSTAGLALTDTLTLDTKRVPQFLVGCSLLSSHQPAGIAGFGRGPSSLPSQLNSTKFSFCLLSHKFDDTLKTTSLDLTISSSRKKTEGVSYTPFLKNPKVAGKARYSVYYYLGLRRIEINGKRVKIPGHYLSSPDPVTGSGGTIVDSGTTFTYMSKGIYGPLAREIERQANGLKRDRKTEEVTGLGLCFEVSENTTVSFPTMVFGFKGGAKMELPVANYVALVGEPVAACVTIVSDGIGEEGDAGVGPAVILGNFQMQNFYVEYDLKEERFGFKKQRCG